MSPRKPDFFIVGAPKCGTSALYHYFRQHPEIFVPEVKEPHFFSADLEHPFAIRDEREYLSLFSKAHEEKRLGETSATYLYSRVAASKIKKFCPSPRIIVMLRNPVDMMYSLHSQRLYSGNEDISDFEAALRAEEQRKRSASLPEGTFPFYKETAKYTQQIQRYIDAFGWDHICIIIYDDLKKDEPGICKEVFYFLGVNQNFLPKFGVVNTNKRVRSNALHSILRNPLLAPHSGNTLLPRSLRRFSTGVLTRLNTRYEKRTPMDPELRRRLQREFAPEVERLSELLGRDLTHWSRD